jgi:rubrerythrin
LIWDEFTGVIKLSAKEELIKTIEAAIKDERQAQIDYKKAAEMAEDPETRAFFEQLAKDEEGHEKILKRRLAALKLMK